jgi:hypothetical protein
MPVQACWMGSWFPQNPLVVVLVVEDDDGSLPLPTPIACLG